MSVKRIYVEKMPEYAVEAKSLLWEIRHILLIPEAAEIAADGTVTKVDAPLVDNAGNEIVAAGGASVEDGVITGTMNYFVAGVQVA